MVQVQVYDLSNLRWIDGISIRSGAITSAYVLHNEFDPWMSRYPWFDRARDTDRDSKPDFGLTNLDISSPMLVNRNVQLYWLVGLQPYSIYTIYILRSIQIIIGKEMVSFLTTYYASWYEDLALGVAVEILRAELSVTLLCSVTPYNVGKLSEMMYNLNIIRCVEPIRYHHLQNSLTVLPQINIFYHCIKWFFV